VPGEPVAGRALLPPGATDLVVKLHRRGRWWTLKVAADGTFSWDTGPPGPWAVRATAKHPSGDLRAEVEVPAGGSREVVLDLR
jgi:hypothetical protein